MELVVQTMIRKRRKEILQETLQQFQKESTATMQKYLRLCQDKKKQVRSEWRALAGNIKATHYLLAQMIFDGEKLKADIVSLLEVQNLLLTTAISSTLADHFAVLEFGPETWIVWQICHYSRRTGWRSWEASTILRAKVAAWFEWHRQDSGIGDGTCAITNWRQIGRSQESDEPHCEKGQEERPIPRSLASDFGGLSKHHQLHFHQFMGQ